MTGIGDVPVKIPKVRAKDGKPVTFHSALVSPYVRKAKSLEASLPWIYLKGVSTGEMGEPLKTRVGSNAKGLLASTVSRLKQEGGGNISSGIYDGIYSGLRSEDTKLHTLVIIGVNEQCQKHFLAIGDGVCESRQSWREVLLRLKDRGMNAPPLAIGDGALGFWKALDEIYGDTRHQRCWVHKRANILNKLPKSSQPKVKQALHDIWQAETKENAERAFDLFIQIYEAKYPKSTLCLQKDREELLAFYNHPAQHWESIRTNNLIESTFGTIRHRRKRAKGCLSREGMLHMMFKLSGCAQKKWRKLRGFDYLGKVTRGVQFKDGVEVISNEQVAA